MISRRFVWFWMVPLVLVASGPGAAAATAAISDLQAYPEGSDLKISLNIDQCFTEKMIEAIRSGVVTTFRILIVIEGPGPALFRTKLLDTHFDHTLKYDRLTEQYHVSRDEQERQDLTTDFDLARRLMSEVRAVPILPLWRLEKDKVYRIRIKAELAKVRLPSLLRTVFFFVSLWDFDTAWETVEFRT